MKFFYLYAVGLINLALGYAFARWLKRRREHDAAPLERGPSRNGEPSPGEAVVELMARLGEYSGIFGGYRESLADGETPLAELKCVANQIGAAVKELLHALNETISSFSDQVEGDETHEEIAARLEEHWGEMNDAAVQLVTLTFDGDGQQEAATLIRVAERCGSICGQARASLERLVERQGNSGDSNFVKPPA